MKTYDILIKNALVLDGTGNAGINAQLAIKDGKIARIAESICATADTVIDGTGLVVTPGFIDSHSHSDRQFFSCPQQTEKVEQGITAAVCGQCGDSVCGADSVDFLKNARNTALGIHMAMLIGHGSLRKAVMGTENRAPTEEELDAMKNLLSQAMEQGALGISFGLIYVPGCYADTRELIEMAKVVAAYKGIAASHIRGESIALVEATAEFIEIVRVSGVRGVLSHHKVVGGKAHWGKVNTTLAMLDAAVAEGLEIYADVYPYIASQTKFSNIIIPAEFRSEGTDALLEKIRQPEIITMLRQKYYNRYPDTQQILLTACPNAPQYEGLRMPEVAALMGVDEFTAMIKLTELTRDQAKACFFGACEEDVERVMAHPRTMICTDSGVRTAAATAYHPRLRGSFPRVLGRYVRERNVTSLPEMIRKMTSLPAQVYGFATKGLLREGYDADICIFDPDTIIDQADYANPGLHALGLRYVIVGGKIAATDAVATGALGGTMLYRPQ